MAIKSSSLKVLSDHSAELKNRKKGLSRDLAEVIKKANVIESERSAIQKQIDDIDKATLEIDQDVEDSKGIKG